MTTRFRVEPDDGGTWAVCRYERLRGKWHYMGCVMQLVRRREDARAAAAERNKWRPRVGEQVSYPDLPGERRIGRVWSYEGHTLVAVDLACGIARGRFQLSDLRPAPQAPRKVQ